MKKAIIIFLLISIGLFSNTKTKFMESANFNENTSTAFGLLGTSPATINNFGSAKEIKVDWVYKSGKLVDNIAIEFKPFWYAFFKKVDYKEYESLRYLTKKLADTSFSVGMVTENKTNRMAAFSVNLNLYKKADPLVDKNLLKQINSIFLDKEKQVLEQSIIKEMQYEMEINQARKAELKLEIEDLNRELNELDKQEETRIEKIINNYKIKNWNKVFINLGYGNLQNFTFDSDNKNFSYIKTNADNIIWTHYGFPVKEAVLIALLNRYSFDNTALCSGLNIRTKLNKLNTFFVEFISYNSFKGMQKNYYNISFGGNFKIKKIYLNLGFKSVFDYKFKFSGFHPKYGVSFRM